MGIPHGTMPLLGGRNAMTQRPTRPRRDGVLEAVDTLLTTLRKTQTSLRNAIGRAERLKRHRHAGRTWSEISRAEEQPTLEDLTGKHVVEIETARGRLRRARARAL